MEQHIKSDDLISEVKQQLAISRSQVQELKSVQAVERGQTVHSLLLVCFFGAGLAFLCEIFVLNLKSLTSSGFHDLIPSVAVFFCFGLVWEAKQLSEHRTRVRAMGHLVERLDRAIEIAEKALLEEIAKTELPSVLGIIPKKYIYGDDFTKFLWGLDKPPAQKEQDE